MVCFPRYGRWTHDLHLYYCRAVVRIHIYISGIKTLSHIYRMRTIVLEALPGRPTVSRLPHPQFSIVQQNLISFYYLHYSKLKTNLHRKNITATKYKLNITDIHHTCFVFFCLLTLISFTMEQILPSFFFKTVGGRARSLAESRDSRDQQPPFPPLRPQREHYWPYLT